MLQSNPRRNRSPRSFVAEPLEGRLMLCDPIVPEVQPAALTGGTTGNKTVLYIRTAYSDRPTVEPQTLLNAQALMTQVDEFIHANSYGQTRLTPTFTNLIVLPGTELHYLTSGEFTLRSDALNAARNEAARLNALDGGSRNWDATTYMLDAVRYNGGPGTFNGLAVLGSRGAWLKNDSPGTAAHEFGHNFGLGHATLWYADHPQTVIGLDRASSMATHSTRWLMARRRRRTSTPRASVSSAGCRRRTCSI